MPTTNFKYVRVGAPEEKFGKGFTMNTLKKEEFASFDPTLLGLGDISMEGTYTQALVAFLDLEGFTSFTNQIDSHLVIPEFMTRFIDWLFERIATRSKEGEEENRVRLWGSLPYFVKFLGDGILFIWDTRYSGGDTGIKNNIYMLVTLVVNYQNDFLPSIKKHVSKPPSKLRCGIARGQIISVGDNQDFVGACINIASRLQKLSLLTIAISRRGIDLHMKPYPKHWDKFILKKTRLRGIGDEELVYVLKDEFEALRSSDKKLFQDP